MGIQTRRGIQTSVRQQANQFAERLAEVERKARTHLSDLVKWRRAYLATYLAWFAAGKSPEPHGRLTSMEAVEAAADEFKDRLVFIENRVGKEAGYFDRPELLYGALRWLATTYRDSKTGARSCPDFDKSCRKASGFWYTAHQSEVTMGQYASDYEVTWGGKRVKLEGARWLRRESGPEAHYPGRVFLRRQKQDGRRGIRRTTPANPSDVTPSHAPSRDPEPEPDRAATNRVDEKSFACSLMPIASHRRTPLHIATVFSSKLFLYFIAPSPVHSRKGGDVNWISTLRKSKS